MTRAIPPEAFELYFSLGPSRSYSAVAEEYGVTKRAVAKAADREQWQKRLSERERKAREIAEKNAVETLEAINRRHLAAVRTIQGKALEALRGMSLSTAMEAVRALELGIKQERLIVGEPSERAAVSVEDKIEREYERWLDGHPGTNGRG